MIKNLIDVINLGIISFNSVENGKEIVEFLEMLLYAIAHNIKLPLEIVIDFTELVQTDILPENDAMEEFTSLWLLMLIQGCKRYNDEICKS